MSIKYKHLKPLGTKTIAAIFLPTAGGRKQGSRPRSGAAKCSKHRVPRGVLYKFARVSCTIRAAAAVAANIFRSSFSADSEAMTPQRGTANCCCCWYLDDTHVQALKTKRGEKAPPWRFVNYLLKSLFLRAFALRRSYLVSGLCNSLNSSVAADITQSLRHSAQLEADKNEGRQERAKPDAFLRYRHAGPSQLPRPRS